MSLNVYFFITKPHPPKSTLFPYTTLFRSTSYQDRYRAIPGDDQNATTRWTTQAPGKGNGDGVILDRKSARENSSHPATSAAVIESNQIWHHLRIAVFVPGLTTGTGSGTPP